MAKTPAPPRGAPPGATRPIDSDAAPVARAPAKGIRVEATKLGYYGDQRRRVGDVFTIDGTLDDRKEVEVPTADGRQVWKENPRYGEVAAFSKAWMRLVDPATPERLTTGRQELEQLRRDTRAARLESTQLAHVTDDVLGADE